MYAISRIATTAFRAVQGGPAILQTCPGHAVRRKTFRAAGPLRKGSRIWQCCKAGVTKPSGENRLGCRAGSAKNSPGRREKEAMPIQQCCQAIWATRQLLSKAALLQNSFGTTRPAKKSCGSVVKAVLPGHPGRPAILQTCPGHAVRRKTFRAAGPLRKGSRIWQCCKAGVTKPSGETAWAVGSAKNSPGLCCDVVKPSEPSGSCCPKSFFSKTCPVAENGPGELKT